VKSQNRKKKTTVSRRQMLQVLAALGITGPAALELAAQARKKVSPEILKTANALIDQDFSDERLKVIATALQRNLDQFQIVRDLEIDDLIEPAMIFMAKPR
jgi:hypothetical protein